jgi:RNA-directed DNA polymerase
VRHADAAAREARDRKGDRIIEAAVERENMLAAWRRVKANKGAPGVDDMTVEALWPWLQANWSRVKTQLLEGRYRPSPVRRVEIPKPGKKGMRQLGIPTACSYCTSRCEG